MLTSRKGNLKALNGRHLPLNSIYSPLKVCYNKAYLLRGFTYSMENRYEKRLYTAKYDGFDGGWSMCDTQYETFCIWVGELNPAFISFSQICDAYDVENECYKDIEIANVDNVNIVIPSKILDDIAKAEYYWEIHT